MPMRLLRQGATVPVVEWLESNRLSREGVAMKEAIKVQAGLITFSPMSSSSLIKDKIGPR